MITGAWRSSRMAATLISFSAMSRMRFFSLRFARLPADAAELVELHAGLVRAVAAQQLDVLDRQIELVAALIDHLEAIMRLAGGLDGGEADEAADAVVGVDHEIADREARGFGEHVAAASWAACGAPAGRRECPARR